MKNFNLKNKVKLLFTLLFAFLLLILNNNVFAVEYESEHYFEITRGSTVYRISANEPFYCLPDEGYWTPYSIESDEMINVSLFKDGSDFWGYEVGYHTISIQSSDLVSNSKGTVILYNDSSKTEVFFPVAPPEEETPEVGTLQEIMEQMEKETVLKEIIMLLPVILSVLVSLIALRKALKMLLAFLRVS